MAIISLFSGSYCYADEIAEKVSQELNYKLLSTDSLIDDAVKRFSTTKEKLMRAMHGSPSFLNNITHEKEKHVAFLKYAMANCVMSDNVVYHGFAGLLLPQKITHMLRICVIANRDYRIEQAVKTEGIAGKEANKRIRRNDNKSVRWSYYISDKTAWDKSLYDIVIPMHSTSVDEAVAIICKNALNEALATTPESQKSVEDLMTAAQVNIALMEKGHTHGIECREGNITITLNKYVLQFDSYKNKLSEIAMTVPGVKSVEVKFGPNVHRPGRYPDLEIDLPSKILLVDDEVEYIHTLSERLKTRRFESTVVYDGEEALTVVNEEQPEVMILDLKMPGIDGLEVLRKVKTTNPNVGVIIVTGHGSERERVLAEELGAFAYLEKPVNIEELTRTMQAAYQKVNEQKDET